MGEIQQDEREDLWGYRKRLRFVRSTIAKFFLTLPNSEIRVLDVGCGNASKLALPLAREGLRVFGIDTHEQSIAHAKSLASDVPNAIFRYASAEELSTEDGFHVVILSEVLEHLENPKSLLSTASDRMRRDGVMIVTVPNGYGGFEIDSWVFRSLRLQRLVDLLSRNSVQALGGTDNFESGHIQFFTRKKLSKLFNDCGLMVMRRGVGPLLAGPIVGHTLARSPVFIEWNARITNRLPFSWASGWYFVLQKQPPGSSELAYESRSAGT